MSELHVDDRATELAAFGEAAPGYAEARAHLLSCARCAAALREAEGDLALLDALPPPPAMDPEVLRAIETAVLRELPAAGALVAVRAAAVALAFVLFVAIAKRRAPEAEAWGLALAAVLVSVTCVLARRVNAGGRVAAGFAVAVGLAAVGAKTGGLAPIVGIKCVAIELVAAALPLTAAIHAQRKWGIALRSLEGAVIGTAGALAGYAALHLTCPVRDAAAHLFVFHVGGVALAAAMGAFAALRAGRRPWA